MAKRQPPKRLFKSQDRISSYHEASQSPVKRMKRMSEEHEDLLQNIEFVLVDRHRRDPGMDDRAASAALRTSLGRSGPSDDRVAELVEALASIRAFREDVPDDVWADALRVVDDSVHRHSDLRPGEKGYLSFVSQFIK